MMKLELKLKLYHINKSNHIFLSNVLQTSEILMASRQQTFPVTMAMCHRSIILNVSISFTLLDSLPNALRSETISVLLSWKSCFW